VGDLLKGLPRKVSHALRHEPWLYELEVDAAGWVCLDQLLRRAYCRWVGSVHLSADWDTAVQVGRRKGEELVVLSVCALDAHNAGVSFFVGNASVWLAAAVPVRFISHPIC
jgi:RNA:NAD 2'-phosphotransferase (TPT1/KptA family)